MSRRRYIRCFIIIVVLLVFLSLLSVVILVEYMHEDSWPTDIYNRGSLPTWIHEGDPEEAKKESIPVPIILWWTGFTKEHGAYKTCGKDNCFFTVKRKYRNHPNLKVFMFYGTDVEVTDLPLPRQPHHEWAVLHEESPKNNVLFSFEDMLILFNYTSTFRRESHYPITTQYVESLKWLMSTEYVKSIHLKNQLQRAKDLAPIMYIQSDCDPPSDRDSYVKLLMKHIPVDSYGLCLNNKKLPKHLQDPVTGMFHKELYDLMSQYKFVLAMENAVCKDYITEKVWRPLTLGVVPIIFGSPSVKDMLPSNHSAIVITDYKDVQSLAGHIHRLNRNDIEYNRYLAWKRDGINNTLLHDHLSHRNWSPDMISGFECFVCQQVHENIHRMMGGLPPIHHVANVSHYGCPVPYVFDENGRYGKKENGDWKYEWMYKGKVAKMLRWYVENNKTFTKEELDLTNSDTDGFV